jgi:hypothetical protein
VGRGPTSSLSKVEIALKQPDSPMLLVSRCYQIPYDVSSDPVNQPMIAGIASGNILL